MITINHMQGLKEEQPPELPDSQEYIGHSIKNVSPFVDQYWRLLGGFTFEAIDQTTLVALLLNQGIKYNKNNEHQQLQIVLEEYSSNYEALKLGVTYGSFCSSLYLINLDVKKTLSHSTESFAGAFGSVEKCLVDGKTFAVKSIKFEDESFACIFREVVKQCFLLKIASVLRVGPNAERIFGFDMVAYKNCIDFSMEFCESASVSDSHGQLERSLSILHRFRIVHLDIKPENISFSHKYSQHVLIDFGLSRAIKEEIGEKSYTNFVGSFIFCTNQMLELYTNEATGFVDLYYNDAYCLSETLKKLSTQIPQIKEAVLLPQPIRELSAKDVSLKHKFQIFQISCGITQKIYTSKLIGSLSLPKLHSFFLNLPQPLNILPHYNYLKKYYQFEQKITDKETNHRADDTIDDIPHPFKKRFNQIANINKEENSLRLIQRQSEQEQRMLTDGQTLKQTKFSIYCLALIRFIKINGGNISFQKKIKACHKYSQIFLKEAIQNKDSAMYRKVIKSLFQISLSSKEGERYQILRNCVQTVAVLEIVPEDGFIEAYFAVFDWQLRFVQTVRLAFEFITTLEFVREKYRKTYNYDRLLNIFMIKLNNFVEQSSSSITDFQQKAIIDRLKEITILHINPKPTNPQHYYYPQKQTTTFSLELKLLSYDLAVYKSCFLLSSGISQYSHYNQKRLQGLIWWINKRSNYSCKFTFVHLVIFSILCFTNQIWKIRSIYNHFERQFKAHLEYTDFSIYFINKFYNFKSALSRTLVPIEDYRNSIEMPILSNVPLHYEDFFQTLDKTIKFSDNFHLFLSQLLYIPAFIDNPVCYKNLFDLIINNNERVLKIIYRPHPKGRHVDNFKRHILLLNNLLEFIAKTEYNQSVSSKLAEQIMNSLKECEGIINKIDCLQCKVFVIIQLKLFVQEDQYFESNNCQTIVDFLIIAFKNVQLQSLVFPIILLLMRSIHFRDELFQKYDLKRLFYLFIREKKKFCYCLINICQEDLFLSLFIMLSITEPVQQLIFFIYSLSRQIGQKRSVQMIDQFYYRVSNMVKTSMKHFSSKFKKAQSEIIKKMYQQYDLRLNPYICLYLIAYLQIKERNAYVQTIMKSISYSLNFLDSYARKIVLNRYYYFYAFYLSVSQRKNTYLKGKHFKNSFEKFSLKFLLKSKIRITPKNCLVRKNISHILRFHVESYHQNLDNIK